MHTRFSSLKQKEKKKCLECLRAGCRMILKLVLERGCGLDSSGSGYCSFESWCDHDNKRYTAGRGFLGWLTENVPRK